MEPFDPPAALMDGNNAHRRGARLVARERSESVLQHVHTLFDAGPVAGLTDGQLLERFASRRGEAAEAAFAALVERHGPMVLRACRGISGDDHDAQDAFQATFLVLARKGGTLWVRDSLAPWLHRVACRAAARVKVAASRRRAAERRAAEMARDRADAGGRDDLGQILHEEVDRLPDRYRVPIVLCDLEGRPHEEAARHLGCPVGTIKSRLSRGRERLRGRLTRRGISPPAGLLGAAIVPEAAPEAVPATLRESTIQAALRGQAGGPATAGAVSASVAALAGGVLRAMLWTKMRTAAAFALAAALAAAGLALLPRGAADAHPRAPAGPAQTKAEVAGTSPDPGPRGGSPSPPAKADRAPRGGLVVVADPDQAKVWAYSPKTKTWHTYKAPEGVKVFPFASNDLAALAVRGERVTEIAAFPVGAKQWNRQALSEPAKGEFHPTIHNDFAIYTIGHHAYAFSARTGTWSRQDLDEVEGQPSPLVASGFALYLVGHHAYAFSAETGRWEAMDFKDRVKRVPQQGPDGMMLFLVGNRLYTFDPRTGHFRDVESDGE
jgi:RNA polymerase sigma factor (sigma-70 family)